MVEDSHPCATCGLCCDGTLFRWARLDPEEAVPQPIVPSIDPADVHHFLLPCTALAGPTCTVYAERPGACRAYACTTLRALDGEAIDPATARARIAHAKALRADTLAAGDGRSLTRLRFLADMAKGGYGADPADGPALALLAELEAALDRDFRRAAEPDELSPR